MPADGSTTARPDALRHALRIALVYLLVRCIPELLFYGLNALPADTLKSLVEDHAFWLRHIFPIVPLPAHSLPIGFQQSFALLPVLLVEVLLVFLFSTGFLRSTPSAPSIKDPRRWVILIAATLVWSVAVRHQLLDLVQDDAIQNLQAIQTQDNWVDELPRFLVKAQAMFLGIVYGTAALWALLPTWLHFRFARRQAVDAGAIAQTDNQTQDGAPLARATVFASFLLGSLSLHIVLLGVICVGLWPWTAASLRIPFPRDVLSEMSGPMTLSQIVFGSLVCALAAYVYARRARVDAASGKQLVIKPALAGVVAYLLTGFLLLVLVWLLAWAIPGVFGSVLEGLAQKPESGIVFAVALNVASLVLLCIAAGRVRASPRRWSVLLGFLVLLTLVPAYVTWTLIGATKGMVGAEPGAAITGGLGDARWRNMEQWCTGVVETRHGTWLVGRSDDAGPAASYVPDGTPDLTRLMTADGEANESLGRGGFGSRPTLTTLARLQDDGKFKLVATVPDVACLIVSPRDDTLYLLTGLDRPDSALSTEPQQTAVFRSTDHGKTWAWMKSGLMPEADQLAWNLQPSFGPGQSVWAWGPEAAEEEKAADISGTPLAAETRKAADGTDLKPTALFHSANGGETSTAVYGPAPLIAPQSYLREMTGATDTNFSGRREMDQTRFVVQIDDTRAYAWASEFMWYRVGQDSRRLMLSSRADLTRSGPNGDWQITRVTRQPGTRIAHLRSAHDGRTYAVLQDKDGEWLAKLDTKTGEWVERQKTPSLLPDWLAQDRTSTRYFWNNGDYQVLSRSGDTMVSRALIPFLKKQAEIDTEAHFYTRDGGRSWHQLAIPGYLGVMGLSSQGSKLYWSKGNWYSDKEPVQWEYDLAK